MNKTQFNKLHKHTITINGNKYKICHLKEDEYGPCDHCDCDKNLDDCIEYIEIDNGYNPNRTSCDLTIGKGIYLKLIHHVKNKVQ